MFIKLLVVSRFGPGWRVCDCHFVLDPGPAGMASENISVHGESIFGHKTATSSKLGYLLPYLCNGVKGQPIAIFI